jgi:hypothetical protein
MVYFSDPRKGARCWVKGLDVAADDVVQAQAVLTAITEEGGAGQ